MQAILAVEDGFTLVGQSFTGPGESSGEVIFNTGMTGYQEVLTDPSYAGQMVTMTYPLIGNYGVNPEDVESDRVHVAAFLVKECCKDPSNWRSTETLPDYLKRHNVLGVEALDTRALTRHIRLHGAMRGVISTEESDPQKLVERAKAIPPMEGLNLADQVSTKTPYAWIDNAPKPVALNGSPYPWPGKGPRVVVYDLGIKWNILRLLADQGLDLLVVPASFSKEQVDALQPDSVFLSNGPGDPAAVSGAIETTAALCEDYPLAGICLGHQILGLALGGTTYKLKFGHHGCNHPVKDLELGHIEISSQNHGFCVDIESLNDVRLTHVNLNDQTLEGFAHNSKPVIAIQFHPEASPGPHDSRVFFKRYRELIRETTGK
ncbi:MAG: carbamoyl-phosphate synthase small subunit [Desulfovibrio sp.]|nr:MAG: carbamoyl-phosphate synthase small subunit [Desulfovibrio sp.]